MRFDFFRSLALTAIFTVEMGHAVKLENVEAVFHNAPAWAELDNQPVIPFKLTQIDNESDAVKDDPKSGDSTPEEKVVSSESEFSDGKDAQKADAEVNEKIQEAKEKNIVDKAKKIDEAKDKDKDGTTQQKPAGKTVDPAKIKADAEKKKMEEAKAKVDAEKKIKEEAKAKTEAEAKIKTDAEKEKKEEAKAKALFQAVKAEAEAKAKAEEKAKKDAEYAASLKAKFKVQDEAVLTMSKKVQTLEKQLKESEAKHRKWESLQLVMDLEKSTGNIPSKDGAKAPAAGTTAKPDAKAGAKTDVKTDAKPDAKPDVKTDAKAEVKA